MTASRVRPATELELPAIVDIYIRAYSQPPWNEHHEPVSSEGYLRWVMQLPGTHCLLAVEHGGAGETITGFVLVGPRAYQDFVQDWERLAERPPEGWPVLNGRLGYIWEIAVDPGAQRRGHGTAMLAAAIDVLREQGVEILVLRSSERATAAVGLYRRLGFQRLPVRERHDALSGPWALRVSTK
ncbi:MAG TPA: N-acetyltransferase [Chloroflexota bacterium]|nr:N-acetyltransferase [Chloroflexota bacterium]